MHKEPMRLPRFVLAMIEEKIDTKLTQCHWKDYIPRLGSVLRDIPKEVCQQNYRAFTNETA